MSLVEFFKSFTDTTVDKTDLLKQLQNSEKLISDVVLPSIDRLSAWVDNNPSRFRHKELQKIMTTIGRIDSNISTRSGSAFLNSFSKELKNVVEVLFQVETFIIDEFPDKINKKTLDARELAVLNSGSHIEFIARYAVTVLDYMVDKTLEGVFLDYSKTSPAIEKYIQENLVNFAKLLKAYASLKDGYVKDVKKIPDIEVDLKNENLLNVFMKGRSKVLSITNGDVRGFIGSPFYTLAMWYAEVQASVYDILNTRKKQLELKLTYLESDEPNPAIEKQIKYYKNKIEDIEYRLEKIRQSAED